MTRDFYLPLDVSLTPSDVRHHYDENEVLPAHSLVIQPLMKSCKEAFVYGLKINDNLYTNNSDVLISYRGKFKFDTSKECVIGHEYLWNATNWKRGSIVIIIEKNSIDFKTLFKNCYRPGLNGTPNTGNSISAIRKCKEEARDNTAICFPASNGIEWMQIYTTPKLTEMLLAEAQQYCQELEYFSKIENNE